MVLSWNFKKSLPSLSKSATVAFRSLQCNYHWGTYDATGGCCKMRDKTMTQCLANKSICQPGPSFNPCYQRPKTPSDDYQYHIREIYQRNYCCNDETCPVRIDTIYKPSDKCRRYQRTWPECPQIWLRPQDSCCPDPEHSLLSKRRKRTPPGPPLTAREKHLFQMQLLCKQFLTDSRCRPARRPPSCHRVKRPSSCKKPLAPFPSFSECQKSVRGICPTECQCKVIPSMCDIWMQFQRSRGKLPCCTQPSVMPCKHNRFGSI